MERSSRHMILHPNEWPLLNLPLKNPGNVESDGFPACAVFAPPLIATVISETEPIKIYLGTIYQDLSTCETKTYKNVDELLADGWVVD